MQAAVGSAEQIRAWAKEEDNTLQSVIASNFQKPFTIAQKREVELQMLSQSEREAISGARGTWAMLEP